MYNSPLVLTKLRLLIFVSTVMVHCLLFYVAQQRLSSKEKQQEQSFQQVPQNNICLCSSDKALQWL